MEYNMSKIILTDCDGVILDWAPAFMDWMRDRGYVAVSNAKSYYNIHDKFGIDRAEAKKLVNYFNQSARVGYIDALRDSVYYVKLLHEKHGYTFHAITSMHTDPYAQKLRIMNLKALFGENTFSRFTILGCGDDKDEALEPYRGTNYWWIEDKPENATAGTSVGLRSILVDHPHNQDYRDCPRAFDWEDIYELITGE